jgi:HEAT repeat protein
VTQAAVEDVLQALRTGLDSPDVLLCLGSAQALGNFGPRAAAAVPRLKALLEDKQAGVRKSAASALEKIAPPSRPTGNRGG